MKALTEASENIYQRYFDVVKLYQNNIIDDHCPFAGTPDFHQCHFPLENLWIMRTAEDDESGAMDEVQFSPAPYLLAEEEEDAVASQSGSSLIPAFKSRLFLVTDVCLTPHGHILTDTSKATSSQYVNRFMTGKMYDDDNEIRSSIKVLQAAGEGDGAPFLPVAMTITGAPVLLLVMPHASNFGHEFLDLYPQLFMFKELLKRDPELRVLVRAPLSATKLFPVLRAMDLAPEDLNYLVWGGDHDRDLYCLDKVITTTSSYANHVNPAFVAAFREAVSHNMTFADPAVVELCGEGILFSDRRHQPGRRDLLEGPQVLAALQEWYGAEAASLRGGQSREVRLLRGSETLEETLRLFRSSRVFISVHGAQMSNMMFLQPGAVVIEIQPYQFRDVDVFLNLAPTLGVQAFRYTSMSGGHWTSTSINVEHFLGQVVTFIDALAPRRSCGGDS